VGELYNYIKALHLIFVVTWFAGLFYMPRLFIYHIEAAEKPSPDREILGRQLKIMSRRLWKIITWPSLFLATATAAWLLLLFPAWMDQPWMHMKLALVALLYVYHWKTHLIYRELQRDIIRYSSRYMRIWNEGATMLLFAIVFLAILKNALNWIYGLAGLLVLALLIMLGIRAYKRYREKRGEG